MNIRLNGVIVFLLLVQILSGSPVNFFWKNQTPFSENSNSTQIVPLETWQSGDGQTFSAPFVVPDQRELRLKTITKFPQLKNGQRLFLETQGIAGVCYIYVNDNLLGLVGNGLNPFTVQIPAEFLNSDSLMQIELRLIHPASPKEGFPSIVYTYADEQFLGLPRPIYLKIENPFTISNVQFNLQFTEKEVKAQYRYTVRFANIPPGVRLTETVRNALTGATIFRKMRYSREINRPELTIEGEIPLNQNLLWSPQNPVQLIFRIEAETYGKFKRKIYREMTIGARKFVLKKGQFYLNQKPLNIRGMVYHQNLRAFSEKDYAAKVKMDLTFAKQKGFNAVRLAHFLPDETFLQLADSLGLLVFAELPIWRYPASFFAENYLLEISKKVLTQIPHFYARHPSFVALGLGQEVPVHQAVVQKFMFILKSKIKNAIDILTYISPIPDKPLPPEKVADFYMFDRYRPVQQWQLNSKSLNFPLVGKIGVLTREILQQEQLEAPHQLDRGFFLKGEIYSALHLLQTNGGFVESFQDWYCAFPNVLVNLDQTPFLVPQGLLTLENKPKPWVKLIKDFWQTDETALTQNINARTRPTNFFSILMTLGAVFFFTLYRRLFRLRENFRRSLRHSYGFFVDLRERRIIPLFNSITVGILIALTLSIFVASQIYFFHSSFWLQEIMAVFLAPIGLFKDYLRYSQNKYILTFVLFFLFLLLPFLGALLVKMFAWMNRTKLRFRQGLAVIYWSGAPFVWFFPFSLISYHWLYYQMPLKWLWMLMAFFVLWVNFRMINGFHILFITKTSRVFSVLLLCYFIPLLIFWALFNPPVYWVDYLKLLTQARSLF